MSLVTDIFPYIYPSIPLPSSLSPYLYPSSASAAVLDLARSSIFYYHHLSDTHTPGIWTNSSHRSIIVRVEMYCMGILCLFRTYYPIPSNPASCITVSSGGYYQLPYTCRFGFLPIICLDTMCCSYLVLNYRFTVKLNIYLMVYKPTMRIPLLWAYRCLDAHWWS